MTWKQRSGPPGTKIDAEQEREQRLIAQARAGADWALAALVARYQPTIVRYLTRLTGDQERAALMAEDVFVRMERRLYGPRGGDYLRLWLLRSATDMGLDHLRRPDHRRPLQLHGAESRVNLLADPAADPAAAPAKGPVRALRSGLSRLARARASVQRQLRPLTLASAPTVAPLASLSSEGPQPVTAPTDTAPEAAFAPGAEQASEPLDPALALRHRLVRAVVAELPMDDARCVALHLVAGLNHAEVAHTLGISATSARQRIVEGLRLFGGHYSAALDALGIPAELAYGAAAALPESVGYPGYQGPPTIQRETVTKRITPDDFFSSSWDSLAPSDEAAVSAPPASDTPQKGGELGAAPTMAPYPERVVEADPAVITVALGAEQALRGDEELVLVPVLSANAALRAPEAAPDATLAPTNQPG